MTPLMHQLDPTRPLGDQLVEEFSRLIAIGEWEPGSRVPSVRTLAVDVGVNPATVQKALTALQERGLLIVQSTAGRFVTRDEDRIAATLIELATVHAHEFVAHMQALKIEPEKAQQLVHREWKLVEEKEANGE
ncbi:MAG: GntR family transcriptional regulator [Actinomycetaceae bacterium]|nr:GntR family transcriptional regulator [Arcanobacterium sp.]MDD7687586.1 GntR family transcriptional regulator [Actinomycetaceae bacterium]MDY5273176.1 GntR family transcriptional regulator [Arcanobacterium sp.]